MSQDTQSRDRARELRRATTPAETILWRRLRNRAFAGFKFRRQHPIGPFFADLACAECKLVIELDGETHLGHAAEDQARTEYMEQDGWQVLRFWNNLVFDDIEAVLEAIYRSCEARRLSAPSPPAPLPRVRGRGERHARVPPAQR